MTDTRNNTLPSQNKNEGKTLEQIRDELRLWSQKNKLLLDIFLDAFCIVDATGVVIDFNVAFTELCGESYRKVLKIGDLNQLLEIKVPAAEHPVKRAIESRSALRLDELHGASKAFPQLQLILGAVPILSGQDEAIGALLTIRNVSAENELQKKYDERKKESIMDGLTRLYNKVYAEGQLIRAIKTAFREHTRLSIMMCDIDHFKKVNDTYGHQAGDYVLSTVAQMLLGETRESDLVGRFGGEEFIVILSNSDQEGAKIFGERFRKRVAETQIIFDGKNIPVTVSLGSSTFSEKWAPGQSAEQAAKELVSRADTALYCAKASGRNRCLQHEDLPAPEERPKKQGAGH